MDRTKASDAFNAGSIPVGCILISANLFQRKESGKLSMMKAVKTFFTVTLHTWIMKHSILAASILFAVTVAVVGVVVFGIASKDNLVTTDPGKSDAEVSESDSAQEEPEKDLTLQCDADPEMKRVVEEYHKALAEDDAETIKKYLLYVSEDELVTISVKSEYVEAYNNIKCYSQQGHDENSYFVYVYYQLKMKDFDMLVPGLSGFYYCPNEAGEYHIYRKADMSEAVCASFYEAYMQQEVQDLYKTVKLEYDTLLDQNEELKTFMDGFEALVTDEVVKRIAIRETSEALVASSETTEPESSEQDTAGTETGSEQVKATTTVNVRSSDSETADKLGKVTTGTVLTRLEQKLNGWSKVVYEGKEGYIKSEYLVSLDDGGNDADDADESTTGKYVKVKENVNVRAEASETAQKLGLAYQGTKLELIEKLDNGWTKVKYEGQTAYVKSEYVE